jgi:hypothetical protein
MSLTKHVKLQRQINELILKGLVKESKSSCVVPALLVDNVY